jgi:hypothetical protein
MYRLCWDNIQNHDEIYADAVCMCAHRGQALIYIASIVFSPCEYNGYIPEYRRDVHPPLSICQFRNSFPTFYRRPVWTQLQHWNEYNIFSPQIITPALGPKVCVPRSLCARSSKGYAWLFVHALISVDLSISLLPIYMPERLLLPRCNRTRRSTQPCRIRQERSCTNQKKKKKKVHAVQIVGPHIAQPVWFVPRLNRFMRLSWVPNWSL